MIYNDYIDNIVDCVASLEATFSLLSDIKNTGRDNLTDIELAFTRLSINNAGSFINSNSLDLCPSIESDNYFEYSDVTVSMESIGKAIKSGLSSAKTAIINFIRKIKEWIENKFTKIGSLRANAIKIVGALEVSEQDKYYIRTSMFSSIRDGGGQTGSLTHLKSVKTAIEKMDNILTTLRGSKQINVDDFDAITIYRTWNKNLQEYYLENKDQHNSEDEKDINSRHVSSAYKWHPIKRTDAILTFKLMADICTKIINGKYQQKINEIVDILEREMMKPTNETNNEANVDGTENASATANHNGRTKCLDILRTYIDNYIIKEFGMYKLRTMDEQNDKISHDELKRSTQPKPNQSGA